ncbi:MAG: hypothetical protein WCK34_14520, partial [Bacteroidota bacterium]
MTKLRLFHTLLIFFIASSVNAQYTRDAAIDFVKNQVLINDISHVKIYVSKDAKSGSIGLPLLHDEPIHFPYSSNWVFFVDDHPFAGWNHPCRYIFIDAITGNDTIIANHQIYPARLGYDFEDISDTPPF